MPCEHANQMIDLAIDRIMRGTDNSGTLMDAACNGDRHYFRNAIAPVIAQMEDEIDGLLRQRNEAQAIVDTLKGSSQ